jgi:signal transduction histidine kinase
MMPSLKLATPLQTLQSEARKRAEQAHQAGQESHSKRRILVVDDEALLLEMLTDLLQPYYEVRTARSGDEALQMMRLGFQPEVILADQRMPQMSGAEFLAKSAELVPKAVHVVLTGYTDVSDIVESINLGHVYLFLTKPWNDDGLLTALQNAFKQHDLVTQNRELRQALKDVEKANVLLKEMNREKSDLMSIVAHDLKNPIGAIVNYAEIIRMGKAADPDSKSYASRIANAGKHVLELIYRMLSVEAIEAGKLEMRPVRLDVSVMAAIIVEGCRAEAERKQLQLHLEAAPQAFVMADEKMMHQILENLLSNALKYSPSGKQVWMRVWRERLIADDGDRHTVRVSVRDQGPGLSDEDKMRLFGKFARLSARPTGGELSTGLGLAIVKRFAEALNGRVWCESELGEGATFVVEMTSVK